MNYALLLCGGTGERLWPQSLPHRPKQFCVLLEGEKTMLDLTLERLPNDFVPVLVGNERMKEHLSFYEDQCEVLYEPAKKNTAISILLGLLEIRKNVEIDPTVVILPCDHYFAQEEFQSFLNYHCQDLSTLTLLGIKPVRAETGFGYINHDQGVIKEFVEKPSLERAQELISAGWVWNSGIFAGPLEMFLDLYRQHLPQVYAQVQEYQETKSKELFLSLPDLSFDTGIMEKHGQGDLLLYPGEWNDLGSWNRLPEDPKKNKAIMVNCQGCISHIDNGNVVLLGLTDLVIAKKDNNLLISHKEEIDKVREALSQIDSLNYRPWGYYEDLAVRETVRFKRIVVYPYQRLSLQYHDFREEFWMIKQGKGIVQIGSETMPAKAGDSFTIPLGAIHRLTNTEGTILEFYEIQSGSQVLESDIHRLEDDYGR